MHPESHMGLKCRVFTPHPAQSPRQVTPWVFLEEVAELHVRTQKAALASQDGGLRQEPNWPVP